MLLNFIQKYFLEINFISPIYFLIDEKFLDYFLFFIILVKLYQFQFFFTLHLILFQYFCLYQKKFNIRISAVIYFLLWSFSPTKS